MAFFGAVLCSRDSINQQEIVGASDYDDEIIYDELDDDSITTGGIHDTLFGNALAFGSACGGTLYLLSASRCRPTMNIFMFMFCIMFVTASTTLCCIYATGTTVTWDRHITHGVFGWMNFRTNRLPLEVVMVLSCNFLGSMGK